MALGRRGWPWSAVFVAIVAGPGKRLQNQLRLIVESRSIVRALVEVGNARGGHPGGIAVRLAPMDARDIFCCG